ncbi:MAG: tetratricopeptide repeat protein [Deltaproteobacteria bacterium]|nr:tetratricopeptide repeat protein [Deltaproteobacteria bacterium]
MMKTKVSTGIITGVAAGLLFLNSGVVNAASATTLPGEKQCVPASVEAQVTSCEGAVKLGSKNGRAQVGTSTKKEREKKKAPVGPSLDRNMVKDILESSFTQKRKARAIDILKQEIQLITRLAQGTPDSDPDKPEILKRLADAYKELYTSINFMARGLEEKIYEANEKGDKELAKKLKAQQLALDKKSTVVREAAVKAYVQIRDKFQDYDAYDQILFAIAYEIDQMAIEVSDEATKSAYRSRAREFYQQLIRNYPNSKYIPHAWMAYGEYYFHEEKNVDQAMKAYEQVVEWGEKDNPNYVIAMYYQAWCLINMQEHKQAINQFNKVIQYAIKNPSNKEAQSVAKRARMELVSPFSKIGNPNEAWSLFQQLGGDRAQAMLDKLAYTYYDEGQWQDAIVVFHQLQKLELDNYQKNNGDDLCKYQTSVTRATINALSKEKQTQEIARQISLSKKFSGEKHDPKKIKECSQESISIAWDIATQWHLEAVGNESSPGTKAPETMQLCIDLYNSILENYPNLDELNVEGFDEKTKPTRYRVAYYKAELYWFMEDWEKCGPAFDKVVDMDPNGMYTPDAAYAAVLCYNKIYVAKRAETDKERKHQINSDDSAIKKKCDKQCAKKRGDEKESCITACKDENKTVLEPVELTTLEKGILKSYGRYICFVKDAPDLANIKYRRARIYYEANMFQEAAVLFKDIAMNHSEDEIGVYAANLYLDSLNALGSMVKTPIDSCYDDLAAVVDVFIDSSKAPGVNLMKDEQFASQIKALKVGVMRKQAESLTKRKRFMEAAEIYLDIYKNYTGVYDDRGMCEVLFNTAINLESARLVMKAIDVRKHMVATYPECEHSKKAAYFIGQNYHALQNFSKAAEYYVKFATKYEGEKESPEAMKNAIMFYIGLNNIEEALNTVSKFEKSYARKDIKSTASVVFSAGFVYFNEEKWEETRKWYTNYLKKYSKAGLYDEQIQAMVMVGDSYWNDRKPNYGKAVQMYQKAISTFEKNNEKVTENMRKAKMLIATAKAKYYVAEQKFLEFEKVKFPEFKGEKGVPSKMQKWWDQKQAKTLSAEQLKEIEEWKKQRKRLARWGYYEEGKSIREQMKMVKKEERREELNIQFEYWAEHDLGPWFTEKTKALTEAANAFGEVAKMHVPEWEMAAAARAADMQLSFMSDIYDSPLPPSMEDDQELIDIYRGAMDEKAEPYRAGAVKAYEHCLNISTKVRWFNENSLRCERELNKLEPLKYPVSEEIRVTPKTEFKYYAAPDPVLKLETEAEQRERKLTQSADAVAEDDNQASEE